MASAAAGLDTPAISVARLIDTRGSAGESFDDPADARVSSGVAHLGQPLRSKLLNERAKCSSPAHACDGDDREEERPLRLVVIAELAKATDVVVAARGKHKTDRRNHRRRESTPPVDDVDQTPTNAAVAVGERMDGLKLRVRDRCQLGGSEVVAVQELDEVGQEAFDVGSPGG